MTNSELNAAIIKAKNRIVDLSNRDGNVSLLIEGAYKRLDTLEREETARRRDGAL